MSDVSANDKPTISGVYALLSELRSEFNGGLRALREEFCAQRTDLVSRAEFEERGKRFDGDFAAMRADIRTAKMEADKALGATNCRIDEQDNLMQRIFITTIVLLATTLLNVVGSIGYILLTRH